MTSPLPNRSFPEERRMATVMFADIQGFTTLAERLDFEIVTDLIKDVWLLVDDIIETYGGYVDKHIGDAVMAVWGAPYAGENDAEQAVTAALALQDEIDKYASNSELPGASELRVRIGINSGMVLAGYVGKKGEYTVMGDTVNVASRMQQVCDPCMVFISESTQRQVRGVFQVRRVVPPLTLRGKTEPTLAYIVEGFSPQPSRARYNSLDSLVTYMVGREVELERLNQLYHQAVSEEKPMLVLVSGESGIGKSRLLLEFTNQLEVSEMPPALIATRALAQTSQVPFYLWKLIWSIRFDLQETDSPEVTRERFLREIQKLWGIQLGPASSVEVAHQVGSLIGMNFNDSPFVSQHPTQNDEYLERSFELTRELLRRMSAYRPLVLLLDDLQYADPGSLNLVLSLVEPSPHPLPVMILGGARPEFAKQNPRWLNYSNIIELGPLAVTAQTVSSAYPALRSYPEPVLEQIAERSDGNPYFLEELAKSLLKSGITPQLPVEDLVRRVQALPIESLRVMLQARLDNLSHEARSVAMLAAVVGRVFWVGAVLAATRIGEKLATGGLSIAPEDVLDRLVQDALRQLVRAELAFPRANTTFSGDQEYIFKHAMLREVAYSLIPLKHVPLYHQAVARWLEAHAALDFKLMAASHYEIGGAMGQAAQIFDYAAEQMLRQGAAREAQEMIDQAELLRNREIKKIKLIPE
jgi:class 3 adenylate cyclase